MALKDLLDGIENIGGYISGEYGKIGQFDTIDMETRLNTNDLSLRQEVYLVL